MTTNNNETPQESHGAKRRRSILVDPSMQLTLSLAVTSFIVGVVLILFMWRELGANEALANLTGLGIDQITTLVNVLSATLAFAAVIYFLFQVTFRVVGPARVIHLSVEGMVEDNFERRIDLRKGDYLTNVANSVKKLSSKMVSDREELKALLCNLESRLKEGDTEAALRMLDSFRARRGFAPTDARTPETSPV